MSDVYAIKDWMKWNYLAEAAKHDEISWHKQPVRLTSIRYRRAVKSREGQGAVAFFEQLKKIAAVCKADGVLVNAGQAIDADEAADLTGFPPRDARRYWAMLAAPEWGWLVPVENPKAAGSKPAGKRDKAVSILPPEQEQDLDSAAAAVGLRHDGGQETDSKPAGGFTDDQIGQRAAYIVGKRRIANGDSWLPPGKAWITLATALKLAALPITQQDVDDAVNDARASRNTLRNPAGHVIAALHKAAKAAGGAG